MLVAAEQASIPSLTFRSFPDSSRSVFNTVAVLDFDGAIRGAIRSEGDQVTQLLAIELMKQLETERFDRHHDQSIRHR